MRAGTLIIIGVIASIMALMPLSITGLVAGLCCIITGFEKIDKEIEEEQTKKEEEPHE